MTPLAQFAPKGTAPKAVFIIVTNTENELLVFERACDGNLGLPGGCVDDTDINPIHTGLRELHEETGINLEYLMDEEDYKDNFIISDVVMAKGKTPVQFVTYTDFINEGEHTLNALEEFAHEGKSKWVSLEEFLATESIYLDVNTYAVWHTCLAGNFANTRFQYWFTNDVSPVITTLIALVKSVGDRMKHVKTASFEVETKSDGSPVTEADMVAHNLITSVLRYWDLPILSEEGTIYPEYDDKDRDFDKYWCVDPLDGTKEFLKDNGEYTINIALIEDEKPVFGIVFAPESNRFYMGHVDDTAISGIIQEDLTIVSEEIAVENFKPTGVAVLSRSHLNEGTKKYTDFCMGTTDYTAESCGSSLKFMQIATNKADVYTRANNLNSWDIAASVAILSSLGIPCRTITDDGDNIVIGDELTFPFTKPEMPHFVVKNPKL